MAALGRQFGPYRIVALLGAGGMGQVYRAHDSNLGRDVAIKTLPAEFERDSDRLARFRREARTLASLNHPNIAAIYGLEKSGDVECLVMELVEGETLRGPLAIKRALEYAHQVAEGLEAAHEKGIIHRDLKPANVSCRSRESLYVLSGLLLNDTILQPERHHVDTGGYTEHLFALCHLLGIEFMPRIKDLADQQLYKLNRDRHYGSLDESTGTFLPSGSSSLIAASFATAISTKS